MPKVQCPACGNAFLADGSRKRFCDHACYVAFLRTQGAQTLVDRFWAKVKRLGPDDCWLWTAATIKGYGQFHLPRDAYHQNVTVYAHRYAWTITNGQLPDSKHVCHVCDQPLCCNTRHMFLGSAADNLADARAKGRLVDGRHLIKVDDAGVRDIRANYRSHENGKQLAAKYGISLGSLLRIAKGTQRVSRPQPRLVYATPSTPVFERVPHVDLPVRGEVA